MQSGFEHKLGWPVINETPADLPKLGDKNKNLSDIFEISESLTGLLPEYETFSLIIPVDRLSKTE